MLFFKVSISAFYQCCEFHQKSWCWYVISCLVFIFVFEISVVDKQGMCVPSASGSPLIDVRRSSGISGRSALAFALSISCQTVCMFEGAWTSRPFHSDEWLFSSVLLPSYEKGDLVIGRLYEAIKNVCQSPVSNAISKQKRRVLWGWMCVGKEDRMVKRPYTSASNSYFPFPFI